MTSSFAIQPLLRPRSVAIVGASDDPSRAGGRPLHYLLNGGFKGRIVPINPKRATVQGLQALNSILDLQDPVDCAVLAVSADQTVNALRECAHAGVKSAVIFSSGFGEAGEVGKERQAELVEIGRQANMRILGPNCLGLYDTASRAFLTMSGLFQDKFPERGSLGVVSQSGGYAGQVAFVANKRGIRIGSWVTTGNEADIDLSEILMAYAGDPNISTVMAYIEGIRDGCRFVDALRALHTARKPMIAFKVGSSLSGSEAIASHTASMAGEDAVYDAVFEEFGVQRVQSTEEALDIVHAAGIAGLPRGTRFAAVSTSGGLGGQLADLAEENGLDMPRTSRGLAAELTAIAPLGAAANPVDVSGQVVNDPTIMGRSVAALGASGQYDLVHCFIGFSAGIGWLSERYLETMAVGAKAARDLFKIATISGSDDLIQRYENMGYAVFEEPARGIRAAAALARIARSFSVREALPTHSDASIKAIAGSEPESLILDAAGIKRPQSIIAADEFAAVDAAATLGGSVVLKIMSPDIPHKTEMGGVTLNLRGEAALREAAAEMIRTVRERAPKARIEGLEVSTMITGGIECVLAWHSDPVFGPIVTFGMGGVLVEVLQDTAIHRAPVTEAAARSMILSLRSRKLFEGYRRATAVDIDAVAGVIARFSQVAASLYSDVPEFEINPLLVREGKEPAIALDTLLRLRGDRHG